MKKIVATLLKIALLVALVFLMYLVITIIMSDDGSKDGSNDTKEAVFIEEQTDDEDIMKFLTAINDISVDIDGIPMIPNIKSVKRILVEESYSGVTYHKLYTKDGGIYAEWEW